MFWLTVGGDFGRQARCRREGASVYFYFFGKREIFLGEYIFRERRLL